MSGKSGGGGSRQPSPDEMFGAAARWNRLNQYTPYGSVEYSGPYNNIVTQTLSPELLAIQNQMYGLRGGALDNLLAQYGASPANLGNPTPDMGKGQEAGGTGTTAPPGSSAYGDVIGSLPGIGQDLPDLFSNLPGLDPYLDLGSLPAVQGLDLSQLQAIPGAGDLEALRGSTEQALFERSRSLLDPVYQRQQEQLAQEYANRGMPVGAEERTEEFDLFNQGRERAYQQAANEAVIGGRQEVNDILANAMGLRGQGLGEQMALFGTGMQGRGQTLSERLAQLGANQGARGQLFQELLGSRGQLFGEQMGTRQQLYNELMGTRGAEFNQLASILGLSGIPSAAGDLGGFYGPGMVDVMGGYGVNQAANQAQSDFWSNIIGGLFGGAGSALGGWYAGR